MAGPSSSSGMYRNARAVTPTDGVKFTPPLDAVYVGNQGNLAVVTENGQTVTITAAVGWIYVRCEQVLSTGTTATGITGVW
jgi:hypothetical protein